MQICRMRTTAFLLLLLPSAAGLQLLSAPRAPPPAPQRAPAPRAALLFEPETATAAATTLLAAEDTFGEVFKAGMSIAFAAVGTTVMVGVLVRGRYDDIEQSFFDAQDEQIAEDERRRTSMDNGGGQAVTNFFGDLNPTEASPAAAPPTAQPVREPADQTSE